MNNHADSILDFNFDTLNQISTSNSFGVDQAYPPSSEIELSSVLTFVSSAGYSEVP